MTDCRKQVLILLDLFYDIKSIDDAEASIKELTKKIAHLREILGYDDE